MTKFENEALYELLSMKVKELKELSEKEKTQEIVERKAVAELSELAEKVRGDIFFVDTRIKNHEEGNAHKNAIF